MRTDSNPSKRGEIIKPGSQAPGLRKSSVFQSLEGGDINGRTAPHRSDSMTMRTKNAAGLRLSVRELARTRVEPPIFPYTTYSSQTVGVVNFFVRSSTSVT